jgi:hypothetical protein
MGAIQANAAGSLLGSFKATVHGSDTFGDVFDAMDRLVA